MQYTRNPNAKAPRCGRSRGPGHKGPVHGLLHCAKILSCNPSRAGRRLLRARPFSRQGSCIEYRPARRARQRVYPGLKVSRMMNTCPACGTAGGLELKSSNAPACCARQRVCPRALSMCKRTEASAIGPGGTARSREDNRVEK